MLGVLICWYTWNAEILVFWNAGMFGMVCMICMLWSGGMLVYWYAWYTGMLVCLVRWYAGMLVRGGPEGICAMMTPPYKNPRQNKCTDANLYRGLVGGVTDHSSTKF